MRRFAVAAAVAAALALAAPAAAEEPLAARVNGVGITQAEFERSWQQFLRQSGIPMSHADKEGEVAGFRRKVIDSLVDEELIAQDAARMKYAGSPEQVAADVAAARAKFPSEEEYRAALAQSGLTEERLAALYARRAGIELYVEAEIAKKASVADAEVGEFYRANPAEFERPEQVRARHILVAAPEGADAAVKAAARSKADGLLARIRGGADFAALAKESSECPSAPEGGDLGFFARGQMVEAFDSAAFALTPGEVSGVVETPFGFHLIRLEERRPAGAVPEAEAAPQIREFLEARKSQQLLSERIAELRGKGKVEILLAN